MSNLKERSTVSYYHNLAFDTRDNKSLDIRVTVDERTGKAETQFVVRRMRSGRELGAFANFLDARLHYRRVFTHRGAA